MQEEVRHHGKVVKQELKDREAVETQINSVKSWVQETKEYLGNPTIEIDAQLEELQVQNSPHSLYPSFKKKNCPDFNQTHWFIINEILNEFKIFSNVLHKRFLVLFHGIFVCSI